MSSGRQLICRSVSHEASAGAPADLQPVGVEAGDAVWDDPPWIPSDSGSVAIGLDGGVYPSPSECWRVGAEYLLWWRKGRWFPPLVTTSDPGTPPTESGILGFPTTHVAFGGRRLGDGPEAGGRLSLGHWLDGCRRMGVAARFFALNDATVAFSLDSSVQPNIARPFVDAQTGEPFALDIAYSNGSQPASQGAVLVLSDSDVLGGDVYFRWLWLATPTSRLDFLAGYQFARIDENLVISSTSTSLEDGLSADVRDVFRTRNEFDGGEIGLLLDSRRAPWRLAMLAKVAFGGMRQRVAIHGATTFTNAQDDVSTSNSGLFAQEATNSGLHSQNQFAVSPELVITLSRRLTRRWNFSMGYSLIYWSRVVQPGNQIDTTVDRRLLGGAGDLDPPAQRPEFVFRDTDYWLQGLNFGLNCWF